MIEIGERISKSLLYERITKRLMDMIETGDILPGEQFPTERELVKGLGISRNVLREAFHILEEKGIITSIQGKGRFLRKVPTSAESSSELVFDLQKTSLIEIYDVRKVLETSVVENLAKNARSENVTSIAKVYDQLCDRFVKTNKTIGEMQMHLAYANNCSNYYLRYLMKMTIENILAYMDKSFSKVVEEYQMSDFIEDHRKIINAIMFHDVYGAREAMLLHLSRTAERVGNFNSSEYRTE